jgi:hypothetical protein
MTLTSLLIGETEYRIADFNSLKTPDVKIKGTNYMPLAIALLERITDNQLKTITRKNNTILFEDLKDCFTYRHGLERYDTHCICGKPIIQVYEIDNIESDESHEIGSECINNWTLSNFMLKSVRIDEIKRIYNTKGITDEITICYFCNRNTTNKKCKNCHPQNVCFNRFHAWKAVIKRDRELKHKVISQWSKWRSPPKQFITKCLRYIQEKLKRMKYEIANYTPLLVPKDDHRFATLCGAFYSTDNKRWFAPVMNTNLERYKITYLSVPFRLKDEAKANGAQWDTKKKQWYCNNKSLSKSKFLQNWE